MADGYRVDLTALHAAAHGIRGVLAQTRASATPDPGRSGHDSLDAALVSFLDGWRTGVRALAADGHALADRLDADERAYRGAENRGAHLFGSVLDGQGPDPAAG